MTLRTLLLVLPCAILSAFPARIGASQALPAASAGGTPAPGDSGGGNQSGGGNPAPSASDPGNRKLLAATAVDGHLSLGLFVPVSEENVGITSRAALVTRWNPTFRGWEARAAAGSVFWQALDPELTSSSAQERPSKLALFLDEAWLRYAVRAAGWTAGFQAGLFRWRSHADAALTGEYLARWAPYPIRIVREERGYEAPDSLTTIFEGLRVALASPGRVARQEILAALDTWEGTRFLIVIGSTTLAPLPGLEAAIGAALHEPLESRGPYTYARPMLGADGQILRDTVTGEPQMRYERIEYRSRTYSARMSLDLAILILGEARSDRGGRFFAEAALLGWEDYPFYYPEKSRRIQFCAGLNLPAFGILDIARLQAERRAYPVASYYDLRPFGGPVSGPLDAGPSHWWSGQAFVARSLLPWLEMQGTALCEWRQEDPIDFSFAPWTPSAGAQAAPPAVKALWSFQARIMARL